MDNENIDLEKQKSDTVPQNITEEINPIIDVIHEKENNSFIFLDKIKNLQKLIQRESFNKKICK
jgi:hypothetical protein